MNKQPLEGLFVLLLNTLMYELFGSEEFSPSFLTHMQLTKIAWFRNTFLRWNIQTIYCCVCDPAGQSLF